MNNNQNDLVRLAMEKIKRDQKFKPNCNVIIGPTGPAGEIGPTDTYDYFFNKINRNYSSIIPSKYNLE